MSYNFHLEQADIILLGMRNEDFSKKIWIKGGLRGIEFPVFKIVKVWVATA